MARRDGQVKIFGYRVETGEIRNVLCKSEYILLLFHSPCLLLSFTLFFDPLVHVQDAVVVPVKLPSADPNGKVSYELRGFVVLNEAYLNEPYPAYFMNPSI